MPVKPVVLLGTGVSAVIVVVVLLGLAIPLNGSGDVGSPVAITSVTLVPPFNPGGPPLRVALVNVGSEPVRNVSVYIVLNNIYPVWFPNITPTSPLAPGASIASPVETLIGAGFDCSHPYNFEIRGEFVSGFEFSSSVSHEISCPSGSN